MVYHKDKENSFYYYKDPLIRSMNPRKGPTIGGTLVTLLGIGFDDVFYKVNNVNEKLIYYKFVDIHDNVT